MKQVEGMVLRGLILTVMICAAIFAGCSAGGGGGGTAPEMDVTWEGAAVADGAVNYDLGTIQVGQALNYTITVTNSGNRALNFTGNPFRVVLADDDPGNPPVFTLPVDIGVSLAAGANTGFEIQVNAAGAALGPHTAAVSIANDDADENPYDFSIQVTVIAQTPEINVRQDMDDVIAGSNRNFGNVQTGGSAAVTFTIENLGLAALNLTGGPPRVEITGDVEFTLAADAATPVPAEGSTTFDIQYSPTAQESNSATVSIASDDPDEPLYTFTVSGTGIAAAPEINVQEGGVDVPDGTVNYDVGVTANHTPLSITFTIQNTGGGVLNLTGGPWRVAVTGDPEFTLDTDAATPVAAHGSTTFIIAFDPGGVDGTYHASISIDNDDATDDENPYNFTITATAATPGIYVEESGVEVAQASTVDYGSTGAGVPVVKTYTIINDGNADLTISGVVLTGAGGAAYTLDTGGLTSPLAPSASASFTLTFNPVTSGTYNGTITITNNDPVDGTYVFNTTALCEAPEIQVVRTSGNGSPVIMTDGTSYTVTGAAGRLNFRIDNQGNTDLVIDSMTIVVNDGGAFSLQSLTYPITVPSGGSTTFYVDYTGGSIFHNCEIEINCNDYDEDPFNIIFKAKD
jgi:hypothetical protein